MSVCSSWFSCSEHVLCCLLSSGNRWSPRRCFHIILW